MSKLEGLIAYFIKKIPYKITRTELVKFVYWFEYLRVQTYGQQLTEAKFIRYNYGPYSHEIVSTAEQMADVGAIVIEPHICCNGKPSYLHSVGNMNLLNRYTLDNDEDRLIADTTINDLSGLSYNSLIAKVYSTPPMATILFDEEMGVCHDKEELNMKECDHCRKFSREKIEAARQRLDKSSRGSDEEYYAYLLEEKSAYETLRKRADRCILK